MTPVAAEEAAAATFRLLAAAAAAAASSSAARQRAEAVELALSKEVDRNTAALREAVEAKAATERDLFARVRPPLRPGPLTPHPRSVSVRCGAERKEDAHSVPHQPA